MQLWKTKSDDGLCLRHRIKKIANDHGNGGCQAYGMLEYFVLAGHTNPQDSVRLVGVTCWHALIRGPSRKLPGEILWVLPPISWPIGGVLKSDRRAMVDTRTKEQRRRIMQAVKQKDTTPEWSVRRLLHGSGYRYRLHVRSLPGTPDIVFASRRKIIFVHGCFWHGHGCRIGQLPKSKTEYWGPKIAKTRTRDAMKQTALEEMGWNVLTIWQCDTKDLVTLQTRLWSFLGAPKKSIDNG